MANPIQVVNKVSEELSIVKDETQIYQIVYKGIIDLLPETYLLVTKLNPESMNFRIIHSFGLDKFITPVQALIGKNPFDMDFPFSDLKGDRLTTFEKGKLVHYEGGIHDMVNGQINNTLCKTIEKILGISNVYSISFSVNKNHFGGANLFVPKNSLDDGKINEERKLAIEIIAYQASNAINNIRQINLLKIKENNLIVSKSRFEQLINHMNDIVWIADGDGTNMIDLNNTFEKFYGYPVSEFQQNPNLWFEVVHPEDKEKVKESVNKLFSHGNVDCEYRVIRPDGKIIWLHDHKSIVFNNGGKPVQMGGIASDITARKLLEEQLRIKNYALDNSSSPIGISGLDGRITYVNEAFIKLWRYDSKSEVFGKYITEFASNEKELAGAMELLKAGKSYIGEDTNFRNDGTPFSYIVSASMVAIENRPYCIMAVFTDITERSAMESKLRENEKQLLKLNSEKDKFLSIISHDLQSPFNGMLGFLNILESDYKSFSDEERYQFIQLSHQSAQTAFNLLSDLLEWARLQKGKLEIKKEKLNIKALIDECIALLELKASDKQIALKNNIEDEINVNIDRHSINTVVRNLLNNAIKFTGEGGVVEFFAKKTTNEIELNIKDNGVGMSPETIDLLFHIDKNYTTKGTNNEKGTGLGLIICNDLVAKNGWDMKIESQLGEGTTFKILIPINS